MKALILSLGLLGAAEGAQSEPLALPPLTWGVNLGTYHFNRGQGYQEVNPGLYAVYQAPGGARWMGGAYLNSYGALSIHAGRVWAWGPLDIYLGAVTGYPRFPLMPLFAPSIKLGDARLTLLPPVDKTSGGVHLSWEF